MQKLYHRYLRPLYFSRRFYWSAVGVIILFIIAYIANPLFPFVKLVLLLFIILVCIDYAILFKKSHPVTAIRKLADRFSNGDDNPVVIELAGRVPYQLQYMVIDELPDQFQRRDFLLKGILPPEEVSILRYTVRPTERGEYVFHSINVFLKSPLGLVVRRQEIESPQTVKVYPSYLLLRHFELIAYSNNLSEAGSRKIRKVGHSLEFEQIKEYVRGDDIRSVNWKATARKGGQLMVNNYTDERSQQIYCLIDKGRVMKMPFKGMSLLDYAINASLILSRVALIKQDRAGLITFAEETGNFLPADRKSSQMGAILETLYNQQTNFLESDYEKLHSLLKTRVSQRSLIFLFTNFESLTGLQRQLRYIRSIARNHLVLVVFFENTELQSLTEQPVNDVESLYIKTIAEKFAYEKKQIVKELQLHGISTILTAPEHLTVNTVNKYLELKARQAN